MGRTVKRIYLDASCLIYLVESSAPFHDAAVKRVLSHRTSADDVVLTSRLSWLECRVKPIREKDTALLATYEKFCSTGELEMLEITPDVIDRATHLRAGHGFKTPDAIQLATAVLHRADVIITGDKGWPRFRDIPVELVFA